MTPWTAAHQASLSFTITWSLLRLMSIESMMPSNHLILCHSLLLLPSVFPSIRVFSNVLALHTRWPKCWSFSFSISPSNEYSGLISFRIDWFDLLAVQETLKSLLQHHNSKASNSLVFSLFYSPTLTSIHDHWKNHSFDIYIYPLFSRFCSHIGYYRVLRRAPCAMHGLPRVLPVKNLPGNAGDERDVGLICGGMLWRRKWQPIPVFLP